jgi:HTH-type transcriptional regulator, cell division transcriptional repressor
MITAETIGARVIRARKHIAMSQRALAQASGLSQATLSRIEAQVRTPKMDEVVALAWALGCTTGDLTGSAVADRLECAARTTDGADMHAMRSELAFYLTLDAYLEDQAIPAVA